MEEIQQAYYIDALVDAYQAIDRLAQRCVKGTSSIIGELASTEKVKLHLGQKKHDRSDPRMYSTHNYSGLGLILIEEGSVREESGDLKRALLLKTRAYELMSYSSALNEIDTLFRAHNRK